MNGAVRFRIIDVECDSADPQVMAALRDLLEQYQPCSAPGGLTPVSVGYVPPVASEPAAAPPAPRPLRVKVALDEKPPAANPTGRVEGFVEQARGQAGEVERLVELVNERPGIKVDELARVTLGSANPRNVRRVDMLIGPAVMAGRLARSNGQLFATAAQAAAAPMLPARKRGTAAPLNDVDRNKKAFDRVVERFTQDSSYPLDKLAHELFGDSARLSLNKVQVMLSRLVATERLERVGKDEWSPPGSKKLGRGDDDEESEADEADLESNGQPDEDADPEELEL